MLHRVLAELEAEEPPLRGETTRSHYRASDGNRCCHVLGLLDDATLSIGMASVPEASMLPSPSATEDMSEELDVLLAQAPSWERTFSASAGYRCTDPVACVLYESDQGEIGDQNVWKSLLEEDDDLMHDDVPSSAAETASKENVLPTLSATSTGSRGPAAKPGHAAQSARAALRWMQANCTHG